MTTVINTYDDQKTADEAIAALREEGFEDRQVQILKGDAKKIMSQISERGFEDADARAYADAAARGRTLILADVSEETADRALSIMDRVVAARRGADGSAVGSVPIVEEELSVGKAKSVTGGARVTTSVSERPVEETVTLRTETVEAKHHSADRVLGAEEAEADFEGKTVEMMGTQEEVEVHKEARVVGEVELTKETSERQETVRDTVRKTEVEVEQVGAGASATRK